MKEQRDHAAFVVRDGGSWYLTPVPVAEPRAIDLDEILSLIDRSTADGGVAALGERAAPSEVAPLAQTAVVAPVWTWVGVVTSAGIALEGNDASTIVLDADDLRLVDALVAPMSVDDLTGATGLADAPSRLARLARAGRLKTPLPGPDHSGGHGG